MAGPLTHTQPQDGAGSPIGRATRRQRAHDLGEVGMSTATPAATAALEAKSMFIRRDLSCGRAACPARVIVNAGNTGLSYGKGHDLLPN
jgi:hypothetical protein